MEPCALCLVPSILRKSHAIPNSVFKTIFRENDGKAIIFDDSESNSIGTSQDSWWQYLLCDFCEQKLSTIEKYSLELLRGNSYLTRHESGATISNADLKSLNLFFISIYWRAAASKHPSYSKVYSPEPLQSQIRNLIYCKSSIPLALVTAKVSKLIDSTVGGFTEENLKEIIISPFFRRIKNGFSFCFLIEGFFVEIFTPGLKSKFRSKYGILNENSRIMMIPNIEVLEIPEVLQLCVAGLRKHTKGLTKIKS